jgi:hypothetical protein
MHVVMYAFVPVLVAPSLRASRNHELGLCPPRILPNISQFLAFIVLHLASRIIVRMLCRIECDVSKPLWSASREMVIETSSVRSFPYEQRSSIAFSPARRNKTRQRAGSTTRSYPDATVDRWEG